jgi:hypothetical protein
MSRCICLSGLAVIVAMALCPTAAAVPGACCLQSDACVLCSSNECSEAGGFYWGDGTPCQPDPCRPGLGVCCSYYGNCTITTFRECVHNTGVCTWMEGDFPCNPNPCPACCPIACCMPDGSCQVVWCGEDCAAIGGTWIQGETFCHPNPCFVSDVPDEDGRDDRNRVTTWGRIRSTYR